MPRRDNDQIQPVVGEIESLNEKFGAPNDQALSHLKRLVLSLRDASNETYFTEKIDSVEHWAVRGFSTRRFGRRLKPGYIDGRDVYPDTFLKEFVDILFGRVDWRSIFDQRGVLILLTEPGTLLARKLGESPGWERIYEDDMSVVFRRR